MKKPNQIIGKYLANHAKVQPLNDWPEDRHYDHVVIMPVCGEPVDCLSRVFSQTPNASVLLILCVNRPADNPNTNLWAEQNQALVAYCQEQWQLVQTFGADCELLTRENAPDVLLLDLNDEPFGDDKGVGLARKYGADAALQLIQNKCIKEPWIFSTDADVTLPADYFEVVKQCSGAAAISLPFEHVSGDAGLQLLQSHYDFKLHYYQAGTSLTGSQYTHIPLGSALIVSALVYAQVRGFPQRSGGEDFYLLNKAAKLGQVACPQAPVIQIQTRISNRVPFGTGPALEDWQTNAKQIEYYHPEVFDQIKGWRAALEAFFERQTLPDQYHQLNEFWQTEAVLTRQLQQTRQQERWQRFIHEWLDAFKFLKSVHVLSEQHPRLPLKQLLEQPKFNAIEKRFAKPLSSFACVKALNLA